LRVKRHMAETRAPAVLFDVDGTLVDSNYLHVYAWQRAFAEQGLSVDAWRIHRSIGMDGSALVRELSDGAAGDIEQRLKELHGQHYRDAAPLLRPLPGAQLLLRRVAELGLQVVLATSAPEDELAMLRDVLDCDDVVSEVTTSRDVDIAEPQPDIIQVALDRAGVTAEKAVFIGDAVWDVEACLRATVPCIGVLTGGTGRAELRNAGATAVFEDPVSCWSTSKRPGWPNWPAETAPRRIVEQGKRACPLANSPSQAHAYLPRLCADLVRTQTASSSEQNSTQPEPRRKAVGGQFIGV
jgi:phosphoglycolate phosphatase-like HAD superfamily hydrolase